MSNTRPAPFLIQGHAPGFGEPVTERDRAMYEAGQQSILDWLEVLFASEKQKLEEYVAESCSGVSPVKIHARTIAQGRLAEIDVLRCRVLAVQRGQQ